MTKDVLVTVKGIQSLEKGDNPEPVEMVAKGDYYWRNGHHFICYEEIVDGFAQPTKNVIKVLPDSVEVQKKGVSNVHMIFKEEKKSMTFYNTPFGSMEMGVSATRIQVKEEEEALDICIDYALEINDVHAADCRICVNVKSQGNGAFSLQGVDK